MLKETDLVELIGDVLYTTLAYAAAVGRGIQGKRQAKAKRRAVEELFKAVAGRLPTEEEHDQMGTATADVY